MKDLKFRAWSTRAAGEMIYFEKFNYNELINEDDWQVMQYIGKKDKNGKYIYEGDIIYKESNPEYTKSEYCKLLFVVEWNEVHCNYFARCIIPHLSASIFWPHVYECEVVGNIYQNPEYL